MTLECRREDIESVLAIYTPETLKSILLYLIENPGASQLEIATHVGCSAPTVAWHMSLLMKIELVYNHKQGKFMKYYIKGNLKEITDLIKSYHPTIWNKLSSRLVIYSLIYRLEILKMKMKMIRHIRFISNFKLITLACFYRAYLSS